MELKTSYKSKGDHFYLKLESMINIIIRQKGQVDNMESQFKIRNMASYTPNKPKENVYRVRAKFGKKTTDLPHIQIRETLLHPNYPTSLSPRKIKHSLFKNAKRIQSRETYLINQKTYKLSKTNESSSPRFSKEKDKTLQRPINCSKNNRSMSNQGGKRGKVIQRTISIVIDGKNQNVNNQKDLMNTLSRIILGEQKSDKQIMIEFLDQSSIYGEQQKFISKDSNFLREIMQAQTDVIEI